MNKHCKGCKHHHNAGRLKGSNLDKYNDWCCKFSNVASKIIGHCKMNEGKSCV